MERPDIIYVLKGMAQKAYDADRWDSTIDTIEETIVELERLRATVTALKHENAHLRHMNRRTIEALVEQMPPGMRITEHNGKWFYDRFMETVGEAGQNPAVTPAKPATFSDKNT